MSELNNIQKLLSYVDRGRVCVRADVVKYLLLTTLMSISSPSLKLVTPKNG